MRLLKYTMVSLFVLVSIFTSMINRAYAQVMTVPFQNVFMFPQHTIRANYTFGPFNTIFCYENNLQTVGVITWPFQGNIFNSQLPIFLKNNANVQGSFADNSGAITIQNTTNITLIVNCVYGY